MDTRVLLATALRPELGLSGSDNGLPVVDSRHPESVEFTIRDLVNSDGQLIVACAQEDYEQIRHIVTLATVRTPGTRVAIEPIPGTPLAIGVIASLADEIGGQESEDQTAWQFAAFDFLRSNMWSAVWLPSVTKLHHPAPSMIQHVRSWFGGGFLAVTGDEPFVVTATKAPLERVPSLPESALISSQSEASGWVLDAVKEAIQPRSSSEMTPVRDSIDSYGSRRAIEFISIPEDFHEQSKPHEDEIHECPGCGTGHARATCPYCKMTTEVRQGVNQ